MPASTSSTPPTSTDGSKGEGITEQILGRWFAQGGGRREKVVIATKLYGSMSDWPNDTFLSARNIRNACEGSLRRLQTDHIDLYQMHHVDRNTPFDEIWEAMEVLVQQGKVLYVGSSNFAGWTIAQAQEAARARHFLGLVSEQCLYNLVERHVEEEVVPAAQHYGVGIIAWSPLMRGLLGGVLAKEQGDRPVGVGELRRSSWPSTARRSSAYEAFCAKLGEHPSAVGLAWLLAQPGVTGADRRTADHGAVPEQPARARRAPRYRGARASSTRCSPVPAPHPRPGPGNPRDQTPAPATFALRSYRTTGPSVKKVARRQEHPEDHQAVDAEEVRGIPAEQRADRAAAGERHRVEGHQRRSVRAQALRAVGQVRHRGRTEAGEPEDAGHEERDHQQHADERRGG